MATAFGQRVTFFDRATFSWPAVLAGVAAALIVQVLLTLLGIGIRLIPVDTSTVATTPVGVNWGSLLYWAISWIIASFVGGWVAGAITPPGTGAAHGLAAWAVASLILIGAATLTPASSTSLAAKLLGPTATSVTHLDALTRGANDRGTVGQQPAASQQDIESARRSVAGSTLASFIALLIGALAALLGGLLGSRTGDVVEREARFTR
jgi:hypothetical protein